MTLVFDKRKQLQGQPGLHAFIVGVSAYPHLPGGTGTPASDSFGMQQLSSSALTAYKMYQWLLERQNDLAVPLATCRLLLSPSQKEVRAQPNLHDLTDPCALNNFLLAAYEWRDDASSHKDNITIFYFVGHGAQRTHDDAIVLLENFGDGIGVPLRNAVTIYNLFKGMAPAATRANMARTQLYFVDTSQISFLHLRKLEWMEPSPVFDIELSAFDDRRAPIFYAAVPSSQAYAQKDSQTIFIKALLQCLNGDAGELREHDGQVQWCVSVRSLVDTLALRIDEWNKMLGVKQNFFVGGLAGDTIIHYLDSPPLVELVLEVEPLEALPVTKVEITDDQGNRLALPAPLAPHPYRSQLPAGYYTISAKIDPPNQHFRDFPRRVRSIMPPLFHLKVRVDAL